MGFPEVCCKLSQGYILPLAEERVHPTGLLSSLVWSWDWSHGERMKLHAWALAQAEVTLQLVQSGTVCVSWTNGLPQALPFTRSHQHLEY